MKLLLIEDNVDIARALRKSMQGLYIVDYAQTGTDGLHLTEVSQYDTIVLDLGLPDITGLEVCREIREQGIKTPMLVLTGSVEIDDKVKLLDAGADDYLTKPFSLAELKARVRVLIRRNAAPGRSSILRIGTLSLDMATRHVEREETTINLRRKEFDLLEYLMHNAGQVVSRSMIVDHVWDINDTLWTNSVDVHIKHLRDKIDRPFSKQLIRTVHGVGYKLEPDKPMVLK